MCVPVLVLTIWDASAAGTARQDRTVASRTERTSVWTDVRCKDPSPSASNVVAEKSAASAQISAGWGPNLTASRREVVSTWAVATPHGRRDPRTWYRFLNEQGPAAWSRIGLSAVLMRLEACDGVGAV